MKTEPKTKGDPSLGGGTTFRGEYSAHVWGRARRMGVWATGILTISVRFCEFVDFSGMEKNAEFRKIVVR